MRQHRGKRGIRRKRVNQGTWFPSAGTSWLGGEGNDFNDLSITNNTSSVALARSDGPNVEVHPLTQDFTQYPSGSAGEATDLRPSLRDYTEGQDYLLKRIVGNIQLFVQDNDDGIQPFDSTQIWTHVQIGAGFFVARAADSDQSLPDLTVDEIDPLSASNAQNSWIWRRTWILDNPQNAFDLNPASPGLRLNYSWDQSSNRQLDAVSGPHFDTKSRRRIKREERLWVAVSVVGWDGAQGSVGGGNAGNIQPFVKYNIDARIFGKMMKGRASATF